MTRQRECKFCDESTEGLFCPTCRLAARFGLRVGAAIAGPLALVAGLVIGWLAR